jgi:hypothetical protein
LLSGYGEPFGDDLAVAIDVARWIEEDRDDGQALNRSRTQFLHARNAVDGILDGARYENFDLLGR